MEVMSAWSRFPNNSHRRRVMQNLNQLWWWEARGDFTTEEGRGKGPRPGVRAVHPTAKTMAGSQPYDHCFAG